SCIAAETPFGSNDERFKFMGICSEDLAPKFIESGVDMCAHIRIVLGLVLRTIDFGIHGVQYSHDHPCEEMGILRDIQTSIVLKQRRSNDTDRFRANRLREQAGPVLLQQV